MSAMLMIAYLALMGLLLAGIAMYRHAAARRRQVERAGRRLERVRRCGEVDGRVG